MTKLLNADIEPLNFADELDQCIKHINKFVAELTKNHIKDFIKNEINRGTIFAMVNAVYFNGEWVCELMFKIEKNEFF